MFNSYRTNTNDTRASFPSEQFKQKDGTVCQRMSNLKIAANSIWNVSVAISVVISCQKGVLCATAWLGQERGIMTCKKVEFQFVESRGKLLYNHTASSESRWITRHATRYSLPLMILFVRSQRTTRHRRCWVHNTARKLNRRYVRSATNVNEETKFHCKYDIPLYRLLVYK